MGCLNRGTVRDKFMSRTVANIPLDNTLSGLISKILALFAYWVM